MTYYLAVLKKYADFSGRARRKEYWFFMLFNTLILVALILLAIGVAAMTNQENWVATPIGIVACIYYLAVLLPSLAVSIRRLHDIGKSGWWFFISFIPYAGGIWLLVLTCLDSQPGANQWGPNPKGESVVATTVTA